MLKKIYRKGFGVLLIGLLISCDKDNQRPISTTPLKPIASEIFIDGLLYTKFVSANDFEWNSSLGIDSVAIYVSDCTFVMKENLNSYGVAMVEAEAAKSYSFQTKNIQCELDHKKRRYVKGLNTGYLFNPAKREFTYFNFCDFTLSGVEQSGKEFFVVLEEGKF